MLAEESAIGHYERVLRALRDANIRFTYGLYRRPAPYAVYMALMIASVVWVINRDVISAVIFSVTFTVLSVLIRRSERGRQRFARWAERHPYPSS